MLSNAHHLSYIHLKRLWVQYTVNQLGIFLSIMEKKIMIQLLSLPTQRSYEYIMMHSLLICSIGPLTTDCIYMLPLGLNRPHNT